MTPNSVTIVRNPARDGMDWLKEGWTTFKARPGAWIGALLLFILIQACISLVPILGGIAGPIVSSFLMGGLMLGCRAHQSGDGFKLDFLFRAFSREYIALALLTLIYLGLLLVAMLPLLIYGVGAGLDNPRPEQFPALMLVVLVSVALTLPVAMGYWLAPALIVDRGLNAWPAFCLSLRGCLGNIRPALSYGLLVLLWGILASLPLMLGWLILAPTLVASNFAAYQHIFKPENNLV